MRVARFAHKAPELLRLREAAERLGYRAPRSLLRRRQLPFRIFREGGRWVVLRDEFEAYLASLRHAPQKVAVASLQEQAIVEEALRKCR